MGYHLSCKEVQATITEAGRKREINTSQTKIHLKFGILSSFAGIGPENRLFSTFLSQKNVTMDQLLKAAMHTNYRNSKPSSSTNKKR